METEENELVIEVTINPETCMASGNCSFWAANSFELPDDKTYSVVKDPYGDPIEKVLAAAKGCPTQSIKVFVDGDRIH